MLNGTEQYRPHEWPLAAGFNADGVWEIRWRDRKGSERVETYEIWWLKPDGSGYRRAA